MPKRLKKRKRSCRAIAEAFKIRKTQAANVVKNEADLREEFENLLLKNEVKLREEFENLQGKRL